MRFAVGFLLALAIAGPCAAEIFPVDVPPPAVVPSLETGARPAPVSFSRMAANLAEGQIFAVVGNALLCRIGGEPLRWRSSMNQFSDPDFERIFRQEFAKAGLKVSGDQTNLFEQDAKAADLQLGALLTDFRAKLCVGPYGLYVVGSGAMKLEWQVYSVSAGKVVARVPSSSGVSDLKSNTVGDLLVQLLQQSFAEGVRQLEADPQFRQIVLSPRPVSISSAPPLAVAFRTNAPPLQLKDAASGAVVIFAGGGSGSGVLISPDGYILTNHHVVGEAGGRVRIRWSDGTEGVGEVMRADRRRDVALIKAPATKGRALAIRQTPVELGETVYAIGTPLRDELQNTVTRGIVSATRMMDGQSFIQSDTPITHGNSGGPLLDEKGAVVGLSDLGTDPSLGSTINFFIPINDALKVLALQPAR